MSLTCGARLGPNEIQSALGAGGMDEVYKARDTRLERIVAIKITRRPAARRSCFSRYHSPRRSESFPSPQTAWLAYPSTETGSAEVYVRPFPARPSGPGSKWQISNASRGSRRFLSVRFPCQRHGYFAGTRCFSSSNQFRTRI
jgi:serine/threonine protein kinase